MTYLDICHDHKVARNKLIIRYFLPNNAKLSQPPAYSLPWRWQPTLRVNALLRIQELLERHKLLLPYCLIYHRPKR